MIRTDTWVYIHIPKTSGTNFIKNAEISAKNLINYGIKYHKNFSHQPLWWWENQNLINNTDCIFSIVRNPYDRFVSFYNHIKSNIQVLEFEDFIRKDQLLTINEIVKNDVGEHGNLLSWKVEWPQVKFIESKSNASVKTYKIENELPLLEKFVGYSFTNTFYNKREHPPWRQYYNKYTLDAIYTIYKEDFLCFGYRRNSYGI